MGKLFLFVESDLPSGRSAGVPSFFPLEPNVEMEIMVFCEICIFACFCMFSFGIRQTDKVLISLKRATGKTEGE